MPEKLDWRLIKESYSNSSAKPQGYTYRARVPGGWLVSVWAGEDKKHGWGGGLTFVPDPGWTWDVDDHPGV